MEKTNRLVRIHLPPPPNKGMQLPEIRRLYKTTQVSLWFSKAFDMVVLLIGERHVHTTSPIKCPVDPFQKWTSVPLYIEQILHHYPKLMFDIFVEDWPSIVALRPAGYGKEKKPTPFSTSSFPLGPVNTFEYFKDCFSESKRKCSFPNARFHFGDVRWHADTQVSMPFVDRTDKFEASIEARDRGVKPRQKTVAEFHEFLDPLLWHRFLGKGLIQEALMNINHSRYPNAKELLTNFYQQKIAAETPILNIHGPRCLKGLMGETKKWSEDRRACFRTAIALRNAGTLLMDVYVLAKMFDGQMRNVIVHAGDFHIRQYEAVLKKLGFNIAFFATDTEDSLCSRVPSMVVLDDYFLRK